MNFFIGGLKLNPQPYLLQILSIHRGRKRFHLCSSTLTFCNNFFPCWMENKVMSSKLVYVEKKSEVKKVRESTVECTCEGLKVDQ